MQKTIVVHRGCGVRSPGGLYAECGVATDGSGLDIEAFLLDPSLAVPEGADLVNKATVWQHPVTGINHLMMWVGAEHYPYVSDFIEEAMRFGISRKLPPNFDLSQLTPKRSRMILVHPKCRNTLWREMVLPRRCRKHIPSHQREHRPQWMEPNVIENAPANVAALLAPASAVDAAAVQPGMCLFKCWELIPRSAAAETLNIDGIDVYHVRRIGSTAYHYQPTGESADGLEPGIFGVFPLHGFALIKDVDGTVNEAARRKLEALGHEYYESAD